jgi:hypothetical protein
MKIVRHFASLLFFCFSSAVSVFAQPNDSSLFEAVTDTPINAGIALMAAAGVGYGLKQLKKRKQ